MPVHYESIEDVSARRISRKITDSTLERHLELCQGAITTILKSRIEVLPSADNINYMIRSLITTSNLDCLPDFHLSISICEKKGQTHLIEEWSLKMDIKKDNGENIKSYRFHDKTSFFQSLYNTVKRSSFEEKLQSGIYNRENVIFDLTAGSCAGSIEQNWSISSLQPVRVKKGVFFSALIKSLESQKLEISRFTIASENNTKVPRTKVPIISIPQQRASSPTPLDSNWKKPISNFSLSPCSNKQFREAFVGSYEESLLSGRMSALPSKPIEGFLAKMNVFSGGCSPQFSLPFSANFYQHKTESFSPYVGTITLDPDFSSTFKIPSKGKFQVIITNPSATAVQFFLVPYDLRDMPFGTKTFLRHCIHVNRPGHSPILRQAIHIQFARLSTGEVFLYRSLRVVFPLRALDDETATTASSFHQPPASIRFSSLTASSDNFTTHPPSAPHDPILARACEQDSYLGYQ